MPIIKIKAVLSFLTIISYGLAYSFLPPCTLSITRVCDESLNSYGPSQCQTHSDCFEGRVCSSSGYCTYPCKSDIDCVEETYCSNLGLCQSLVQVSSQLNIESESQTQSEEQSHEGSENGEKVACTSHTTSICDESLNSIGAFRCELQTDCSEGRSCSRYGYCQDQKTNPIEAESQRQSQKLTVSSLRSAKEPGIPCTSHISIECDENLNSYGPGKCQTNQDCSDIRICSSNECHEQVDPQAHLLTSSDRPACTDRITRDCDESKNKYGPYHCRGIRDCSKGRRCSGDAWCYVPKCNLPGCKHDQDWPED